MWQCVAGSDTNATVAYCEFTRTSSGTDDLAGRPDVLGNGAHQCLVRSVHQRVEEQGRVSIRGADPFDVVNNVMIRVDTELVSATTVDPELDRITYSELSHRGVSCLAAVLVLRWRFSSEVVYTPGRDLAKRARAALYSFGRNQT